MNWKLLGIPLAAMLMAICHGAETMAYHFASEPDLPTRVSECPVLNVAPAATPFVAVGDEIHDLTEVLRNAKVPLVGGWAVWNQTQRLLVAHAGILDQWRIAQLSGFRGQICHTKVTLDWIRSEKPAASTQENDPVFASVGLLSKSATKSTASSHVVDPSGAWSFSVEGESTIGETNFIDSRFEVAWTGPDGDSTQHGDFTTHVCITDGNTLPLASWYVAGHGPAWRVTAKGEIQLADGTAWREALLRQVGDKAEVCGESIAESNSKEFRELPSAGDRKLLTKALGREVIRALVGMSTEQNSAIDPFAEPPNPSPELLPDLPDLVIPANLGDILSGHLLDLRTAITAAGIPLGTDDFVAYDPLAERLVVYCKEQKTLDMLEKIFMVMCCRGIPTNVDCAVWLADGAALESPWTSLSLLVRSGMGSKFELCDAKDQPITTFDVELMVGSEMAIMDLCYDFNVHVQQQSTNLEWQGRTAVTLSNGIPVVTDATKLPDGRSLKQGLRATVVK